MLDITLYKPCDRYFYITVGDKELKAWNDEKVWNKTAAMMLSSVILFFGGLTINIYASVKTKDLYVGVFLGFIFFVLLRWVFWCTWLHWGCNCNIF